MPVGTKHPDLLAERLIISSGSNLTNLSRFVALSVLSLDSTALVSQGPSQSFHETWVYSH